MPNLSEANRFKWVMNETARLGELLEDIEASLVEVESTGQSDRYSHLVKSLQLLEKLLATTIVDAEAYASDVEGVPPGRFNARHWNRITDDLDLFRGLIDAKTYSEMMKSDEVLTTIIWTYEEVANFLVPNECCRQPLRQFLEKFVDLSEIRQQEGRYDAVVTEDLLARLREVAIQASDCVKGFGMDGSVRSTDSCPNCENVWESAPASGPDTGNAGSGDFGVEETARSDDEHVFGGNYP